ncbi:MAG: hypothetical protein H0T42_20940 [Deltaproteobacteria bacterium]|nr:hypothetical protein [Deltaproteobacteria bacterium]
MSRLLWLSLVLAACTSAPGEELDEGGGSDGKGDRAGGSRFDEVDPTHSTVTFRRYIGKALDALAAHDSNLARLTLRSIESGLVKIDDLRELTCADFERVRADLPNLGLEPEDRDSLHARGSDVGEAIEGEIAGYMWSNRIYVSRGQTVMRLAATLVHEVNHVINRSEVGYYDDLPTSAFIHEYRAFFAESVFDPEEYAGVDIDDYVITTYELDRSKIRASVLATPLTPKLLPDDRAWRARRVGADVEVLPAVCR